MVKGFRQIASITALSRVFGLVRTICFTHFIDKSFLDAWFIAFKIPNLSRRLFGEGAASASFIPVYSEQLHEDPKQADAFASTVMTFIFILLAGLVLVGWLGIWGYCKFFKPEAETLRVLSLTSVMLPYMIMVCSVAILAGILNVHRRFAAPAAAPIVLNIFIISAVVITGWAMDISKEQQLFAVAASVLLAGLAQIAIQLPALIGTGVKIRPAWQVHSGAFKKMMIMMGPMILGLTATQINTLFDDIIAWVFSASVDKGLTFEFFGHLIEYPLRRGCVSHLNVAQRLYQMPLGVFAISLATAIFPVMSADAVRKDFDSLRKTISRGMRGVIFIALPATLGLILVGKPLVSALFEHGEFVAEDALATRMTLIFYALGLSGFFAQQILTRAFYSLHESRVPARSALIAVVINLILNLTLIWPLGTRGLALSTAICSYIQVAVLIFALRGRLGGSLADGMAVNVCKTIVGTVFMGLTSGVVLFLMRSLPSGLGGRGYDFARVVLVVIMSAGTYFVAARVLRNEMLGLITGRE